MKRIAFLFEQDIVWSFSALRSTIPLLLSKNYEVVSICVCPSRLSNLDTKQKLLWYLSSFGLTNFLFISLFGLIASIRNLISYPRGFKSLALRYRIPYYYILDPNEESFESFLKTNDIQILVIMCGYILDSRIIQSCTDTVINKHASVLPASKGLLPYIWSYINCFPQGVTFHSVVPQIDSGAILYQEEIPTSQARTLIQFYANVFTSYSSMLLKALENYYQSKEPSYCNANLKSSYNSLPSKDKMHQFFSLKGKIIRFRDLFRAFTL